MENYGDLLANLIREAQGLDDSLLETVPGTNIKIKKGSLANLFNEAHDKVEREEDEFYISKAYDAFSVNKDLVERLNYVNNNLDTVNRNYQKLVTQFREVQKKAGLDPERLAKITKDISEYADSRNHLITAVQNIKNEINSNFAKAVKEQMELIRNDFLTSPRGAEVGYGSNNLAILASDKPHYDSLIDLLRLINEVDNTKKVVCVLGVVCVNEDKVNLAKELINKTKTFSKLKKKEEKVNEKLIGEVKAELRRMEDDTKRLDPDNLSTIDVAGKTILSGFEETYRSLLKMLDYLNEALERPFGVTPVWDGFAYVNGVDREAFIDLIDKTKFRVKNPLISQLEANINFIADLEAYKRKLEMNYNNYDSVTNIPAALADNNTQVLDSEVKKYNSALKLIDILKIPYSGVTLLDAGNNRCFVPLEKLPEVRALLSIIEDKKTNINEIKSSNNQVVSEPTITTPTIASGSTSAGNNSENTPEANNGNNGATEDELTDPVIIAAIEENNKIYPNIDSDIARLESEGKTELDKQELESLKIIKDCLDNFSKHPENTASYKGVTINVADYEKYTDALFNLRELKEKRAEINQEIAKIVEQNNKVYPTIEADIARLETDAQTDLDKEELSVLKTIKECLDNFSKYPENTTTYKGITINKTDSEKYIGAVSALDDLKKKKSKIGDNNKTYSTIEADIVRLETEAKTDFDKRELSALKIIKECLYNVNQGLVDPVTYEGVTVNGNDYERYIKAVIELNNARQEREEAIKREYNEKLEKEKKEKEKAAKKITIKKLSNKAKEYFEKFKKPLSYLGLFIKPFKKKDKKNNIQEQVAEDLDNENSLATLSMKELKKELTGTLVAAHKVGSGEAYKLLMERANLLSKEINERNKGKKVAWQAAQMEQKPTVEVPTPPIENNPTGQDNTTPVVTVPTDAEVLNSLNNDNNSGDEDLDELAKLEAEKDILESEYSKLKPNTQEAIILESKIEDLNDQIAALGKGR